MITTMCAESKHRKKFARSDVTLKSLSMRGIKATNLEYKESLVQVELKIDLSKLWHQLFFPEIAESPYFSNLENGCQKGGPGESQF